MTRARTLLIWVTLLTVVSGCGRGQEQRFVPTEETAQHALETGLTAWQNGKLPPCQVQEGSPAIQLVDTVAGPDRILSGFKVLGATTGEAARCFAVRLTLDNPREEVRARYVVMGLDPLWVIRHEDYVMMTHWDHSMHENPSPAKKPQP